MSSITYGYLGFKRRKLCFLHFSSLENKQNPLYVRIWVPGVTCRGAWGRNQCCPMRRST